MKQVLLTVLLAFQCCVAALAQLEIRENVGASFEIKLNNPHGVVDKWSTLDATLKNVTTDCNLSFIGEHSLEYFYPSIGSALLVRVQFERKDGTLEEDKYEYRPLYFYSKKKNGFFMLGPGESCSSNFSVVAYGPNQGELIGVFANVSVARLSEYKRMRLVTHTKTPMGSSKTEENVIIMYPDGVFSNWIDLSGLDFSALKDVSCL